MIQPTRVLQIAKEKSQRLLSLDTERFTCKLDKFLTVYHGYSQLKPKIFPKRMSAMFPSNVVVVDAGDEQPNRHFQPGFGSTASLKRHRMDWAEKYERTRPGYAESPHATRDEPDRSRRLHIVTGAEVQDRRKSYGGSGITGRGKKLHAKSPKRVVLRTANGPESSADILCSSVLLTYREGLFYKNDRKNQAHCDKNCTEV